MRKIFIISLLFVVNITISVGSAFSIDKETLRLLDLFGDVFETVRKEYVETPSDKKLIEAAINGMLTDLDPHSGYMNKEAFTQMRVETKGEFGGLGIEVTMRDGMVYVISPIDDTPAFNVGIKAGDYFSHIDGESVIGMNINDAVKKMRGKKGEKIVVTVLRKGKEEPFDVTIIRDIIKIKAVRSRSEGDIAYLRISRFSENTASGLLKELDKQKKAIGKNLKGVVLDLRNNPGGLLNQAIAVSDIFLDRGEIVSTKGRLSKSAQRFNAKSGDKTNGLPIVVLINGGSASASEIVAGALQDHNRAVILGTKSFGKGSVQTIIPLPKETAMRLTTSRYYTPSGRSIQAEGITPDIEVKPAKVEYEKINGNGITEASLKGHLEKSGNGEKDRVEKKDKKDIEKAKEDKKFEEMQKIREKMEKGTMYDLDYQLARAIDLLRGIHIFNKK